jgi:hypothetical protein
LPDNENPVKKILLVVSISLNNLVNIDDAAAGGNDNGAEARQQSNECHAETRQCSAETRLGRDNRN